MNAKQAVPFYLQMATLHAGTARMAYQLAKESKLPWDASLKRKATRLIANSHEMPGIGEAVERAAAARVALLSKGIERFLSCPYERIEEPSTVLWQEGSSRLLDYGSEGEATILLVPSLINRAYIFDLSAGRSMARVLAGQGIATAMMDWGEPGDAERELDVEDYVTQRLLKAVQYLFDRYHRPVTLVGYCMGGMMSLAAAQLAPEQVAGIALLTTPWDFHAAEVKRLPETMAFRPFFEGLFTRHPHVSGQLVHQLLYMLDPWSVHEKYRRFAALPEGSEQEYTFLQREHWLHDNVALTRKVAQTCFVRWALDNETMRGTWKVGGQVIAPQNLRLPVFIAHGSYDRLVPRSCTDPLIAAMPHNTLCLPRTGHIGLVAGSAAPRTVWNPLAKWVLRR